jgi:hypothetical protein
MIATWTAPVPAYWETGISGTQTAVTCDPNPACLP